MNRTMRWARTMLMVTTMMMGSLYAAGCSLRDVRDAAASGGLSFVSGNVTDLLGIFFPITDFFQSNNGV